MEEKSFRDDRLSSTGCFAIVLEIERGEGWTVLSRL